MQSLYGKKVEFDRYIGLRYDEQRRVSNLRGRSDSYFFPLYDMEITKYDVIKFWETMPFNLNLPIIDNASMHGNCDLCFLKGTKKLVQLIKETPEKAIWWIKQEEKIMELKNIHETAATFRKNAPNYKEMLNLCQTQFELDFDGDTMDCNCTD